MAFWDSWQRAALEVLGHPRAVAFLQDPRVTRVLVMLVRRAGGVSEWVQLPRRKLAQVCGWALAQDVEMLELRIRRIEEDAVRENERTLPRENA